MPGTTIETYTGKFFDYNDPRPEQVDLTDIARALSQTARFGGHTELFYSVAEHSVLVYDLVCAAGAPPEVCLAALLHDAHEAYLGDVPTPLKALLGYKLDWMIWAADSAIAARFGFNATVFRTGVIKEMDLKAMRLEAAELKKSAGVGPHWGHDEVLRQPPNAIRCYAPIPAENRFRLAFKVAGTHVVRAA